MLPLAGGLKQVRMSCFDPFFHVRAKAGSEFEHLVRFFVGHGACNVIATHVALFTEAVKSVNEFSARRCGELQRLDDAIVMIVPASSVTCSSQGGGCCLQSRIVGDRKPPVSGQLLYLASRKIAIRKRQQVGDLFGTRRVLN